MFHEFRQRFERAITLVSQEADAAITKVTHEADAAFNKVTETTSIRPSDAPLHPQEPSQRSIDCAQGIFANLFDHNNRLNRDYIHTKLGELSLNDNILLVEDKDHYNLLHKAIIFNNAELVEILIEHKFDVSEKITRVNCNVSRRCAHYNLGALHLACYLGHEHIVQRLLEVGADPQQDARIYTSALINCPAHLQPRVLVCGSDDDVSIAARCGNREPIFFAVLGDQVNIVRLFLETAFKFSSRKPMSQYSYLLQLACRSGSEKCLKYLLDKFPNIVNRADSDGLPPLVLVMRHKAGLYLAQLLLEAGADVHLLDNLWNKGNNILHLLYTSGLWVDERTSLSRVSRLCLEQGVDVNAEDQHGHRPLYHLLQQLNGVPTEPPPSCVYKRPSGHSQLQLYVQHLSGEVMEKGARYFREADQDLLLCVQQLLEAGAYTESEVMYLNTNPALRHWQTLLAIRCEDTELVNMLSDKRYGLDNMLTVAGWMIEHSDNKPDYCFSMLVRFLGSVLYITYPFFGATIDHSYVILEDKAMLSGYIDLLDLILPHCEPSYLNTLIIQQLPPLLYVLSKVTETPSEGGNVIPPATAEALAHLLKMLLEAGCSPQIEIETRHGCPRMMGSFDMLIQILETIQEYQRPMCDGYQPLNTLRVLTELLLEYGARTVVYRKLLYGSSHAEAPWCYTTPTHSFLFQFLQFGAQNLRYASHPDYGRLFHVLCNQADGYVLQFVLNTVHEHFIETHMTTEDEQRTTGSSYEPGAGTNTCECGGECRSFLGLLESLLHQCRSLKQLCRQSILHSVPRYTPRALRTLPLPPPLVAYLVDFSQ